MTLGIAFLSCLLTPTVGAQTTSTAILGDGTDPSGAVVTEAQLSITNLGTGQSRWVATNEVGYCNDSGLHRGNYRLSVEKAGARRG